MCKSLFLFMPLLFLRYPLIRSRLLSYAEQPKWQGPRFRGLSSETILQWIDPTKQGSQKGLREPAWGTNRVIIPVHRAVPLSPLDFYLVMITRNNCKFSGLIASYLMRRLLSKIWVGWSKFHHLSLVSWFVGERVVATNKRVTRFGKMPTC